MLLEYKVNKLDAVKEPYKGLYVPDGENGFKLNVSGVSSNKIVSEFRDNNIKLSNELQATKDKLSKYNDVSVDEVTAIKQELEVLKKERESATISTSESKDLENRLVALQKQFSAKEASLQDNNAKLAEMNKVLQEQQNSSLIERFITDAVSKNGNFNSKALEVIQLLGNSVWKVQENGEIVALNKTGGALFSPTNVQVGLSVKEWLEEISARHPYLLVNVSGGASSGNSNNTYGRSGKVDGNSNEDILNNLKDIATGKVSIT